MLKGIDALVLACTHYPLIKSEIVSVYPDTIAVLDSSEVVAQALKAYLKGRASDNLGTEKRFYGVRLYPVV